MWQVCLQLPFKVQPNCLMVNFSPNIFGWAVLNGASQLSNNRMEHSLTFVLALFMYIAVFFKETCLIESTLS